MNRLAGLFSLAVLLTTSYSLADDGAASIAEGGIITMRREARVTMAKEVLEISMQKVTVDYDFRNDSNDDVTTEVAFPIPDYDMSMEEILPSQQGFDDFRLWINGSPATYRTQIRAFVGKTDYTNLLTAMHVDIATFGHATENDNSRDIQRLTVDQKARLRGFRLD